MKKALFLSSVAILAGATSKAQSVKEKNDSIKSYHLDEIVVKATKASETTPIAYTNISGEKLAEKNYGQDIPYLISQTPSVVVTSDAGTGIGYTSYRVRGTDANRINVTVNGVPVNDSESHTVFWVNMPDFASSVENVQVQRGAGTSTNGAASFGATIGMQTQKPSLKPYAEVQSAAGSFMTFKNTVKAGTGLLYDHFVFDARYSKLDSDGFIDRAKADLSSYYASATYYGSNLMVRYQTFGSSERTHQAWNGVPSSMIEEGNRTYNSCGIYYAKDENGEYLKDENGNLIERYYDQTDNYWQQHHHLTAAYQLENNWDMNVTLHYTNGKGYYEDYKENESLTEYQLKPFENNNGTVEESDLVRRKWLRNDFYGGIYNLNYSNEKIHFQLGAGINHYAGNHTGNVIWARNYNNLNPDHAYYDGDASKLDYNVFVKSSYYFTPAWSIFADLQYRGIDYKLDGTNDVWLSDTEQQKLDIHKKYNFFNPKVGVNYAQNGHQAFASFSVANREPNRNNFTDAGINEQPTHETLYDYELGYQFGNKRWNIGANLYYMDYKNQLILTGKLSEIGEALTSNIKDSYRTGIELMGGVNICKWLNWSGNITLSANKIQNFIETVDEYSGEDFDWKGTREIHYEKTDIAMSPSLIANSIFHFNYKKFDASIMSVYVGKQYLDNTSSDDRALDAYFVNNLQMGYTFKPRFMREIVLGIRVNNLFNEKYETNGWVYSYINEDTGNGNDNRSKDDGLFTQAGTNVMGSLTLKF